MATGSALQSGLWYCEFGKWPVSCCSRRRAAPTVGLFSPGFTQNCHIWFRSVRIDGVQARRHHFLSVIAPGSDAPQTAGHQQLLPPGSSSAQPGRRRPHQGYGAAPCTPEELQLGWEELLESGPAGGAAAAGDTGWSRDPAAALQAAAAEAQAQAGPGTTRLGVQQLLPQRHLQAEAAHRLPGDPHQERVAPRRTSSHPDHHHHNFHCPSAFPPTPTNPACSAPAWTPAAVTASDPHHAAQPPPVLGRVFRRRRLLPDRSLPALQAVQPVQPLHRHPVRTLRPVNGCSTLR